MENDPTISASNDENVGSIIKDLPIANIDDKNGNETVLIVRTDDVRDKTKEEVLCSICYYNSEDEDNEEQERKITRNTLYDTRRYGQLYIMNDETPYKSICPHKFHTTCLYQWIKSSREFKCPMCRAEATSMYNKLDKIPELYGSEPEYIVQYYPNGKIQLECYKENGVLEHFLKKYDLLGNLTYECGYNKGDQHGDEITYHEHTNKKAKVQQYNFGVKHGQYIDYSLECDKEGKQIITKRINYYNGMQHGVEEEWFLATRSKKRECHFHEGLKHGTEKIWTITGKLIFYKKFDHGRPIGRCIVRFPDNGCLERKCFYNDYGQLDGLYLEWQYCCKSLTKGTDKNNSKTFGDEQPPNSGNNRSSGFSLIGMLTGGGVKIGNDDSANDNPEVKGFVKTDVVLKKRSHYINGGVVGEYKEYHDNGQLYISSYYNRDSLLDEEYLEFDRSGRCVLRYLYNNGNLDGLCERYYENGKVKECGYYVNNVLNGTNCYRQYYQNGKIKVKQSYNHGVLHGETVYYTQKGTVTARYVYENGRCPDLSFE